MKILQINKYYYQKGGAETVFFNTIQLLKDNQNTVIPFTLKSEKNKPSDYEEYFVDFPELSESGLFTKISNVGSFIYNRKAVKQLERLLIKEKPDIAHIHLLFNSMSVSILPVLKKYNVPVVMTIHDYRLICPAYTFTDGKGNLCEKCLTSQKYWKCTLNKCSDGNLFNSLLLSLDSSFRKYFISPVDYINYFIFVSKFSRNKHIEAVTKYEHKSSVLYNFTHVSNDNEFVAKDDYLLYFGRISEEKGILTLINAVNQIPSVSLKIVGTGPLLNDLKDKYSSSKIEFCGFKSGKELENYIEKAKFVVVPSEWYENNPLTIIESMSLGTPVIGSNIGGIPELINDNESGYLFENKSTVDLCNVLNKALALSNHEYQSMVMKAKEFAKKNFTPNAHIDKLLDIYNYVINEAKK